MTTPIDSIVGGNAAGIVHAYVNMATGAGVPVITDSGNVDTVVRNGTGDHTINYINPVPVGSAPIMISNTVQNFMQIPPTTTSCRVRNRNSSGVNTSVGYCGVTVTGAK